MIVACARRRALAAAFLLPCLALGACRARSASSLAAADGGGPSVAMGDEGTGRAAAAPDSGRLPEDPEGAKEASAQWRVHMAAEERERQLGYDRRKLELHRAVLALIRGARGRYDRARTARAVDKVQAEMPPAIAEIRRRIVQIDHWGNNSKLLGDYAAMLDVLEQTYPAARKSAIEGDRSGLDALQRDWEEREKRMTEWLAEAAATEDD